LKKPLLKAVPEALKPVGAQLSVAILEYSGVKTCHNQIATLNFVLSTLRTRGLVFVDECYFQLIKQTNNNRNAGFLQKTWELLLIVATIFPCSNDRYPWIHAHIAKHAIDQSEKIANIALFTYIRFQARHYLGSVVDPDPERHPPERIPGDMTKGRSWFNVLLYEMMFCQKSTYPKLPIPYILYYSIRLLKERNAERTPNIFKTRGNEALTAEIIAEADYDIEAIARGDVNVIANVLMNWLLSLPNPVVPMEQFPLFLESVEQTRILGFLEQMPQVHQMTLIYIIGFLQDICREVEYTGMDKSSLSLIFGPLFVNPLRVAENDPQRIEKLTELSATLCAKLIEARDPAIVYPLSSVYMVRTAMPRKGDAAPEPSDSDEEPNAPESREAEQAQ